MSADADDAEQRSSEYRGYFRRWPLIGLALAFLWLFVRGVELAPAPLAREFLIGLVVGGGTAFVLRRFYAPSTVIGRDARAAPYMVLFLLVFFRDLLVANVEVAWRVLAPSMPIHPAVVEFPLRVRSAAAITAIATSITLTPGTLTMDYDDDRNVLYVHSIAAKDPDDVIEPIRQWEDYALVIFSEELKPGDPVPEPLPDAESGEDPSTASATDHASGDRGGGA